MNKEQKKHFYCGVINSQERNCFNCKKNRGKMGRIDCIALKEPDYPFRTYGHCWAWTDKDFIFQKDNSQKVILVDLRNLTAKGMNIARLPARRCKGA